MSTPAVMIQGTNSNAGKSVLVAGLCRLFARSGLRVHPFKPQNMSNNAAAVPGGGEIGRAQALQAMAAGVAMRVDHNPVLLKPESDIGAQVVVHGSARGNLRADRFGGRRDELLEAVLYSFKRLSEDADLIIVEGAGSPAETNLRSTDIANMGFATAADVPVVLAGDIDRGGVIASLVGTNVVLSEEDRNQIGGFLINKFRGDVGLFDAGVTDITTRTGWPSFGVVTWCPALARLPAEDAVDLGSDTGQDRSLKIVVPMLSRIANFDDMDPLSLEPEVDLEMVPPGKPLPVADLVIIPGTKATIADLGFFRHQGWDIDLAAHVRRGGRVLGLCGGFQMLGRTIDDPTGVEGAPESVPGLGLLRVDTTLETEKVTRPVTGRHPGSGAPVTGYEIHVGRTVGPDTDRPFLEIEGRAEGASSTDDRIWGSYVHGLFRDDEFRSAFVASLGAPSSLRYDEAVDEALEIWADQLQNQLNSEGLLALAGRTGRHR